jgi:AraC-like DNA-binding protein
VSAPGPTLWSTALRACFAGFAALGLDVDRIRRESGIDAAALADPDARIPFALTARIWPAAQAQWGRRGLGLHTGAALPFGELGVLDYAVASAATIGEGLLELARAFRVVSQGATQFELERAPGGDGVLRFSGPFPPDVRDYGIAGYIVRLRALGALSADVSFVGPAFDDERTYERLLGLRPRFDADANAVALRATDLDRPRTDERYRGLAPIVGREVERLLDELPPPSASAEARRVIARLLPSGTPEGDAVARAMSVSLRTLQRRLTDEGTTIRDVIDSTRESLALAHLASDRLSIGEIAYLLGYSEPGTFTTAFKRWKSMSPSEYRQELAAELRRRSAGALAPGQP